MESPDGFVDWVLSSVSGLGVHVVDTDARVRPWSINLQVTTDGPTYWAKANCPGAAHEAALVEHLGGRFPAAVLAPIAIESSKGWLITQDAGETVAQVKEPIDLSATWSAALKTYARFQRETAQDADTLLNLGVPDMRPSAMATTFDHMLEVTEGFGALERFRSSVSTWADQLAASTIAPSIQHDDLHIGNIFAADLRIFDWGDAVIAHPFASLLNATRSIAQDLDIPAESPEIEGFIERYVAHWPGDPHILRAEADLAMCLGAIGRAAGWERLGPEAYNANPTAIPAWLAIFERRAEALSLE